MHRRHFGVAGEAGGSLSDIPMVRLIAVHMSALTIHLCRTVLGIAVSGVTSITPIRHCAVGRRTKQPWRHCWPRKDTIHSLRFCHGVSKIVSFSTIVVGVLCEIADSLLKLAYRGR